MKLNQEGYKVRSVARLAGYDLGTDLSLGLTPQALCCRPLRGLKSLKVNLFDDKPKPRLQKRDQQFPSLSKIEPSKIQIEVKNPELRRANLRLFYPRYDL